MANAEALAAAFRVFGKSRTGVYVSFKLAIEEYDRIRSIGPNSFTSRGLEASIALATKGVGNNGIALVITGFRTPKEIEAFLQELENASCK